MSVQDWQENNARYLSAALEWLRLRFARLIETRQEAPAAEFVLAGIAAPADDRLARAASEMKTLEDADPPPALVLIGEQFGMSVFERLVLLLCAALELDTRIAGLCADAQQHAQRTSPTFALAMMLFDEPAWDALSPHRPLRYWRLIEISQPAAQALTTSPLRADERIVSYLKGLNVLDDRLAGFLNPIQNAQAGDSLSPLQQGLVNELYQRWQRVPFNAPLPVAQLIGPHSPVKQAAAAQVAARLGGRQVYRLPAELLPTHLPEIENLARLWQRESILLPLALYLDAEELEASGDRAAALQRFLTRAEGLIFLAVRESWTQLPCSHFSLEMLKPTAQEQRGAWSNALGDDQTPLAGRLSAQFDLDFATIQQLAQSVLDETSEALETQLWAACCEQTRPRLDALARRLEPKAMWDDLVLPAEQTGLLRQIAEQVLQRHTVYQAWGFAGKMNRGLGMSVLFAGESGTGKTMAAEVLANTLRLNLYRIDLSAVVSKYIGETEKNLRRLFDAAEDGGAILFFDEADALFGKRSEVKDSHDRYANIEVNYLLQRIESYRGLAILASNLKNALDPAFLRRLRFIVNFPFPGAAERKRIWQRVFPAQTPLTGLDYERLARLNVTGGNIHNIALNAAFMAAQMGTSVSMTQVLAAARTEFRKLDRSFSEAEFHP